MAVTSPALSRDRIGVGNVRVTDAVRRNVAEVVESGWYSPGKWCRRFEREWAEYHDLRFGVFVNSGTSALQVAVAALKEQHDWRDGYRVLVPALTFVASVNVLLQNGLKPVFCDIDPYFGIDLQLDPPPDTVAIMAVHLNGQQCAMDRVMAYAKLHRLLVIEDSCETVGARYQGRMPGTWGAAAGFSTYACHHVTTGIGGFATTNDVKTAVLMRSFANHGRDGIYFTPGGLKAEVIAKRFNFERVGYSYRASEFEAAVGCGLMETLTQDLHDRRTNAEWLNSELTDLPLVLSKARPDAEWWPMFYPVLAPKRDQLELWLEDRDIETRRFMPLTNQPIYRGMVRESDFPFAARVNREGLYCGIFPGADIERIARAFRTFDWST